MDKFGKYNTIHFNLLCNLLSCGFGELCNVLRIKRGKKEQAVRAKTIINVQQCCVSVDI